jgi:hypothetical protein
MRHNLRSGNGANGVARCFGGEKQGWGCVPEPENRNAGGNHPAGISTWRKRMVTHLLLLLLTLMIFDVKVKINIEKR